MKPIKICNPQIFFYFFLTHELNLIAIILYNLTYKNLVNDKKI